MKAVRISGTENYSEEAPELLNLNPAVDAGHGGNLRPGLQL